MGAKFIAGGLWPPTREAPLPPIESWSPTPARREKLEMPGSDVLRAIVSLHSISRPGPVRLHRNGAPASATPFDEAFTGRNGVTWFNLLRVRGLGAVEALRAPSLLRGPRGKIGPASHAGPPVHGFLNAAVLQNPEPVLAPRPPCLVQHHARIDTAASWWGNTGSPCGLA